MTADYQATDPMHAQYHYHYTWQIPSTLIAGQLVSGGISISDTISAVNPDQDLADAIKALAPDFAQQVVDYYHKGDGQKTAGQTYDYTLAADTVTPEFTITIGIVFGSDVVYHFKRTS